MDARHGGTGSPRLAYAATPAPRRLQVAPHRPRGTRARCPRRRDPRARRPRRRLRLLGQPRHQHDRARQPGRAGRRTRASSPARPTPRGRGRRRPRLLGERHTGTIGRADLDGTSVEPELHRRRQRPQRRGGRRRPRLLDQQRRHDRPGQPGRLRAPNQSFITGANFPFGVAVDATHVYWANLARHGRPREPRRHEREPELHHRRQLPRGGGGRRRPRLLDQPRHGTIGRANLDGPSVNQSFITGAG